MFSFSNDAGGLGSAFTGIFSSISRGTSDCGSRPICLTRGSNCEAKLATYNECLNNSNSARYSAQAEVAKSNVKTYVIGAVVVALLIIVALFLFSRKRERN